ncbi:MAG: hypothetical protein WC821_03435 [archaeon]|jgi:hypothetical protein
MDKRETVIESIQKLLALGVADSEIAENLYDVGIAKEEARDLILSAKNPPILKENSALAAIQQNTQSVKQNDLFEEAPSKLSMNDQIINQLPIDKKAEVQPVAKKVVSSAEESNNIADKIMLDVSQQDGNEEEGEDIEDEVEKTLNAVNKYQSQQQVNQNQQNNNQPSQSQKNQSALTPEQKAIDQRLVLQKSIAALKAQNNQVPNSQNVSQSQQVAPSQVSQQNQFQSQQSQFQQKSFSQIPNVGFPVNSANNQNPFSTRPSVSMDSSPDFEELWKKGIVVAVNAKLAEMKHLNEDISAQIQDRVDEAVRKELYQFKILQDSQKELMISSNREALDQKQKEIVFIIDSKIMEIKQHNKQLSETLSAIESSRKQQEMALTQISQALDDAKKVKSQMIVEMNSEMIKTKSQAQAFIDNATTHLNQMDERINKTLELEKNIAEGMLAQAEQKIENLTIQKADDLIANMEVELNRLQTISKKISPEMLEQKISVLEEFKKQFLTSMQQNLTQINSAIDELNQKNILAERTLQEKTLAIDAKIEELSKFEKSFTEKINQMLQ